MSSALDLDLLAAGAKLLFENGQTTEKTVTAVARLGAALGSPARVFAYWGELLIRIDEPEEYQEAVIAAQPTGVDMSKVAAAMRVVEDLCAARIDAATARSSLKTISRYPATGTTHFALMAAAGAAALGVIFGTVHGLSLSLIALSAGVGAYLRRWLAGKSHNLFVQPGCAALLAGIIGALAVRLQLSSALRLVALCPCMVLVPGPHLLNGAMDLIRGRLPLGAARIGYASLLILTICTGLLAGLAIGGVNLPASGHLHSVPLGYDVVAAGVAVAAYGTFFAMPWRMLPIPILIGMLAHACRWAIVVRAGGNAEIGAFAACVVVGTLITPIADRLRLPFAAVGFAAVVSLIPGAYLFRMAGGLVDLIALGENAQPDLLLGTAADAMTAALIFLAMVIGLIVPKMLIERGGVNVRQE